MNGRASIALSIVATALAACAVQATTGPNFAHERRPVAIVLGGVLESNRSDGPTFGGRVGMDVDNGLVPKQGFVHMGYDFRAIPGWLVVEPRLDLGLGRPIAGAYSGVGAYLGAGGSARLRLCGVDDSETAFNVVATRVDVVLGARLGGWAPPEGTGNAQVVTEWGLDVGLRFAISSDVVSGTPGRVEAPATPGDGESKP